jgi:uracil-DNA glycosylase family 4
MVPGNRLVIAEAPGEVESELGEPLVGPSGSWLRGREVDGKRTGGLYKAAGVDEATVSRCNVLNCRPPNNVFPTDPEARSYISLKEAQQAVDHCYHTHVVPILRSRDWKRIDILGGKALQTVCEINPAHGNGITRWRGSPLPVPVIDSERPLAIPTIHPAALARDQSLIPAVISDLKKSLIVPPEHYDTHPSLQTVEAFQATEFAFDIETNRFTGEVLLVGLCAKAFEAIVVPAKGRYLDELRRIFRNASDIVGHNCIQFDLPVLEGLGITSDAKVWDTMLMQHLLQPDLPHDLGFVGSIYTNKPAWKHLSETDPELYCARDTDVTWQAYRQLKPQLRAENLLNLYERVQVPLARLCHLMHTTGIRINSARLTEVRAQLLVERTELEGQIAPELRTREVRVRKRIKAPEGTLSPKTGKPLKYIMVDSTKTVAPWQSQQALAKWLYVEKKLPVQLHVKTGQPTTDKTALPKLLRKTTDPEVSKTIRAIQKLRVIQTLESSFAKESFLGISRVYPHFNVHGTASGRLSSSDPNLQNIPASARYIYVPDHDDWRLIECDYSSIENRLTAWFAQDHERLAKLDRPGYNEHKDTASAFFNIPYEDVEKDNDRDAPYGKAKRINHGCNYGMGARKIAAMYDMDYREVNKLVAQWKILNAKTVAWQTEVAARASKEGYLTNPFGRKRWFYTDSRYTESLSFLPQSTAADIIFRAMLGLFYDRIGLTREALIDVAPIAIALPRPVRLHLQVHDSLLIGAPGHLVPECVEIIRTVMCQPWRELGNYFIPIEIKVGESWGEMKPL